jgi:hypothetical protein
MKTNAIIPLIIAGVFLWGVFHAIGAYTYNHNPLRFWVVLGTDCAFLAFWIAILTARRGRIKRSGHAHRRGPPQP